MLINLNTFCLLINVQLIFDFFQRVNLKSFYNHLFNHKAAAAQIAVIETSQHLKRFIIM